MSFPPSSLPPELDPAAGWLVRRRRALALFGALFVAGVGVTTAAWAYWGASANAGGHGVSLASSVNQAGAPAAVVGAAQAITVTWPATTHDDTTAVTGYQIRRYHAGTNTLQSIGAGCTGTITALTCTETAVPTGQWKYTIRAVTATNWQGPESTPSAQVNVGASVLTLAKTVFGAPLPSNTTGTLTGFAPNEAITYRLDGATPLTGSPATATAGGAATITTLTIPGGTTDGAHTVHAIGGNGSQASFNIVVDTTAPTTNTAAVSPAPNGAGWHKSTPVTVTLSGSDTGGSGVTEIRYTLDGTTPTTSSTSYTTALPITTTTTIKYLVIDAAGNVSTIATKTINVDTAAPVNTLTLSNITGNAVKTGNTIYYRGTNPGSFTLTNTLTDTTGSGPTSSGTSTLTGTSTGFTHTSSTVTTPATGPYVSNPITWTAATTTSPTVTVTGTDTASNTVTTALTLVDDSTGPTGGTIDATGLTGTNSRYSTTTTLNIAFTKGTDTNGPATTGATLTRATATLTSTAGTADGVCGTYSAYAAITGGTDPTSPKADTVTDQACYRYQYAVKDNLGNTTTYTSSDIKVDTTAPTTPTLGFSALASAYYDGSTLWYRGNGTFSGGSITVDAAATDAASGITTANFPATLGSGWTTSTVTSTSAKYTFSSGSSPAAPGAKTVTATNNAGTTGATATFTPTVDSTQPTGGSVSYVNGYTTGASVAVSFTAPNADTGSGLDPSSGRIKRASAPLTNGTCGTFSSTSDLATGVTTSPYIDTAVANDTCYMYEFLLNDRTGNTRVLQSASVAKVSYTATVKATAGLLSYWRLGDAGSVSTKDTMTGTSGVGLTSRAGELGATWTHHAGATTSVLSDVNRVRRSAAGYSLDYATTNQTNPSYAVAADFHNLSNVADDEAGIVARLNTTTGAYYAARYRQSTQTWNIDRYVGTTRTNLAVTAASALSAGTTYNVRLELKGTTSTQLTLFVNNIMRLQVTDATSPLVVAGKAGIMTGYLGSAATQSNTTGLHLDNFIVGSVAADDRGVNDGFYGNGPTVGAAGALVNDTNTAATFDNNASQFVTVARQIQDDFTIQFWFKSTQGAGNSSGWWGNAGLVDGEVGAAVNDFGVSLRSDGKITAGSGKAGGDITMITPVGGYNDGSWHQVVMTRVKTTGAMQLFVDGSLSASATGSLNSFTDPTHLSFARLAPGHTYYAGSLDEVAVYTTALSATTVQDHYNIGSADRRGPVGGSVDATGLVNRYSATTALSIALAKGTDATGVATSGATVTRATATLSMPGTTSGTCGTYGTYTLVANDPASPMADAVTSPACYRYRYTVPDTLGNTTVYTSDDVKVDTTPQLPAPNAPTGLSAARGDAQATASWTASPATGGLTITYTVTATPGGATCSTTSTSCTITGLTNGTTYTLSVKAANVQGTSAASATTNVVPSTVPGAPTALAATPGVATATVTWGAPASNGGATITGYTVAATPTDGTLSTAGCTTAGALTCNLSGLTNGAPYTVTVTATNLVGTGASPAGIDLVTHPSFFTSANLSGWFDASYRANVLTPTATVATTGQKVQSWNDRSGNSRNAVQATAANQMTVGTLGGRQALVSGPLTAYTGVNSTGVFRTIMSAAAPDSTKPYNTMFAAPANTDFSHRVVNGYQPTLTGPYPTNVNDWSYNTGTPTHTWLNSVAASDAVVSPGIFVSESAGAITNSFSLSSAFAPGGSGRGLNGALGEVLAFDSVLTSTERRQAEEYLARKWDINITPQAPAITAVTKPVNGSLKVTWTAPAWDGGSAVTGYTATAGTKTCTAAAGATTCTITALTNGSTYPVTMTATNAVGIGRTSTSVNGTA